MSSEVRQAEFQKGINFTPSTFGSIIGVTGGRVTGLLGIFAILMGGYQSFSYDKSSIKRFYSEDSLADFDPIDDPNSEEKDSELR
mmetsp:Transcript_26015/g.34817  ORF Transcript_26015/g.34817 Transcript_26015/m.34817 type:complete len:85 (+) Transcript_26015:290-544(+)